MKEQMTELVQNAASSKIALTVGLGTASAPAWVQVVNSEYAQAFIIVVGLVVSFTIIGVNVQTLRSRAIEIRLRRRQEKLRLALLEQQAKDKGIVL